MTASSLFEDPVVKQDGAFVVTCYLEVLNPRVVTDIC
jgi:hypothetical protein